MPPEDGYYSDQAAREQLERYGLTQDEGRYSWLLLVALIVGAILLGILLDDHFGLAGFEVAKWTVVLGGIVLGYQQWRAARHEISLDKYYDRLDRANQRFIEWAKAAQHDPRSHAGTMYIFAELDNLEYAVEKYKLGYMRPHLALRALDAFRSRFNDAAHCPDFPNEALPHVKIGAYSRSTRTIVERVVEECQAKSQRAP